MKILIGQNGVTPDCKGRFFRYTESGYSGKNGRLVDSRELRPLKSISCPGCETCSGLDAELAGNIGEKGFLQFNESLESGDTVTLLLVPVSRDQETGALEEYYYEVISANTT